MTGCRWLVCTDLDGTLLDHDHYGLEPARPALSALREREIPVIPVTSKTRHEIAWLRPILGEHLPAVVENGAEILIPVTEPELATADARTEGAWLVHAQGSPRDHILQVLAELRREPGYRFEGFADWDDATVAAHTGLSRTAAALARRRHASEPLIWLGTAAALGGFRQALEAAGLRLLQGGRFLHVLGNHDKGDALRWLCARYRHHWQMPVRSIALGDSQNDLAMLEAADIAVVIASPQADSLAPRGPQQILRTASTGPTGWAEAISKLLSQIQRED